MRQIFPASTIFFDRMTIPQLVCPGPADAHGVNDTGPAHLAAAVAVPVIVIMNGLTHTASRRLETNTG